MLARVVYPQRVELSRLEGEGVGYEAVQSVRRAESDGDPDRLAGSEIACCLCGVRQRERRDETDGA